MILPTMVVLWVYPKVLKMKFFISLCTVLTPLWTPLYEDTVGMNLEADGSSTGGCEESDQRKSFALDFLLSTYLHAGWPWNP